MDKWLSKLESSNWLGHVKDVLTCACVAAQCIDKEGIEYKIIKAKNKLGLSGAAQITTFTVSYRNSSLYIYIYTKPPECVDIIHRTS